MKQSVIKKEEVIDMLEYTEESKVFLRRLKEQLIDKNLDTSLVSPINRKIKTELINDKIIKSLYVELFATYYSGLLNAAVSVGMELLEYVTKKKYAEVKKLKKYPYDIDFHGAICELGKCMIESTRKLKLLDLIDLARSKYRNTQNHGNLVQLVEKNYTISSVDFGKSEIDGKSVYKNIKFSNTIENFDDVYDQRNLAGRIQSTAGSEIIALVNITIAEFFILKDK